jgi:hypothetical protein
MSILFKDAYFILNEFSKKKILFDFPEKQLKSLAENVIKMFPHVNDPQSNIREFITKAHRVTHEFHYDDEPDKSLNMQERALNTQKNILKRFFRKEVEASEAFFVFLCTFDKSTMEYFNQVLYEKLNLRKEIIEVANQFFDIFWDNIVINEMPLMDTGRGWPMRTLSIAEFCDLYAIPPSTVIEKCLRSRDSRKGAITSFIEEQWKKVTKSIGSYNEEFRQGIVGVIHEYENKPTTVGSLIAKAKAIIMINSYTDNCSLYKAMGEHRLMTFELCYGMRAAIIQWIFPNRNFTTNETITPVFFERISTTSDDIQSNRNNFRPRWPNYDENVTRNIDDSYINNFYFDESIAVQPSIGFLPPNNSTNHRVDPVRSQEVQKKPQDDPQVKRKTKKETLTGFNHAKDIAEESENFACTICIENRKCVLAYPCKHLLYCQTCARENADKLSDSNCPVCRAPIDNYDVIFT